MREYIIGNVTIEIVDGDIIKVNSKKISFKELEENILKTIINQ